MKIGILTISDRVSRGEYEDQGGPAIEGYLRTVVASPWTPDMRIVSDGISAVASTMTRMCEDGVGLLLATGGTGPSERDQTPEAMNEVVEKHLPGFGELMRRVSLETVPTAILSRQGAGVRGKTLILTLPGRPSAIRVCLDAVFPAIPYCLELIGAGTIETHPHVVRSFRPA